MVNKPNTLSLGTSYNNISVTYRFLGRYEEALGYNQKALAIYEAVLPDNHPFLAKSYENIAETYRALEQLDKAEVYGAKAASIREKR